MTCKKLFPCCTRKLGFVLFSTLPVCSCLVAHPRGRYASGYIPSPCFAFGSKHCVKGNVSYQFLVLQIHKVTRFFPLIEVYRSLLLLISILCGPVLMSQVFSSCKQVHPTKRAIFGSEIVSEMPGKEHYNLEHSPLECSRFLIRQKLGG